MGTLSFALEEVSKPEVKETRSTLMSNILRLGDPANNPLEAIEIVVKTSKCTALARPKPWKRFAPRERKPADEMDVDSVPTRNHDWGDEEGAKTTVWSQLRMRTEFHVEHDDQEDDEKGNENDMDIDIDGVKNCGAKVEKEQLVRGFKYGSSYVPCPDGQFAKLNTHMGISICGFFNADNVCLLSLFIPRMITPAVSERTFYGRGAIRLGRSSFAPSTGCTLVARPSYGQPQHVCNHPLGLQGQFRTEDGSACPV
jgi:ATP-dependent DNA helicase 2 subunit 2